MLPAMTPTTAPTMATRTSDNAGTFFAFILLIVIRMFFITIRCFHAIISQPIFHMLLAWKVRSSRGLNRRWFCLGRFCVLWKSLCEFSMQTGVGGDSRYEYQLFTRPTERRELEVFIRKRWTRSATT